MAVEPDAQEEEQLANFAWTLIVGGSATLVLLTIYYYLFKVVHAPKIIAGNIKLKNFVHEHIPILQHKYWPSWFLWDGRFQTMFGSVLRIPDAEELVYDAREIIQLADGGIVALDFLDATPDSAKEREAPLQQGKQRPPAASLRALILPGLTSDSQASYVKTIALAIREAGGSVAVMIYRGRGGLPLKTPKMYCGTSHQDMKETVEYLAGKHPNEKFLAIGTSMGGMLLTQYLINHSAHAEKHFHAALAISICFDPNLATPNFEKPYINKHVLNYALTKNLIEMANMHREVLMQRDFDFEKINASRTIKEFHTHLTAPEFDYESIDEFYDDCDITKRLDKFSVPVFCLNALDDIFQPGEHLPVRETLLPDSKLVLIVTQRGGHLGFLEGSYRKPFHYMEKVVKEFVEAIQLHVDQL